jgi:hypothetical protein
VACWNAKNDRLGLNIRKNERTSANCRMRSDRDPLNNRRPAADMTTTSQAKLPGKRASRGDMTMRANLASIINAGRRIDYVNLILMPGCTAAPAIPPGAGLNMNML